MEARGQRHGVIPQPDPCAATAQDPFPSLPTAADLGSTQGQGRPSAKDSIQGSASGRLGGPCLCVGLLSESSALSQGSAPPLSEVAGPSGCLVCEKCYTLTDPGTPIVPGLGLRLRTPPTVPGSLWAAASVPGAARVPLRSPKEILLFLCKTGGIGKTVYFCLLS